MHAVHSLGTIVQFCSNLQFSILYRHHFLHIEVHRKTVLSRHLGKVVSFLFIIFVCKRVRLESGSSFPIMVHNLTLSFNM
ncbi:hypothetical protein PRUPE_7G117500 [Prunus persica]|uniref:Uncharacterized protein n=1 Tax=Prunus persica TaxID=3760 RepID=A0A251NAA5_PRUPE|nr:hypothetical protein PRUPE_7G117500 [Prunus persica]